MPPLIRRASIASRDALPGSKLHRTPPLYASDPLAVTALPSWRDRLLHLLLPAPCLACGTPLPSARAAAAPTLGLCLPCRAQLRPLPASACAICCLPLSGGGAVALPPGWPCQACRDERPSFERLLALWSYEEPLTAVVRALKFRRLDYLGRHLGEALAARFAAQLGAIDLVVPVPLHWRRRLRRGYNQAERMATPLARELGLPVVPLLRRTRSTPPQSLLGRAARVANLRRAFQVSDPARLRGRHLLLVDDVATTGATLEAAAAVLRAAGAAAVTAVTAGRTLSH